MLNSADNVPTPRSTLERDVSKFRLKRSQSAVSLNTAMSEELKTKPQSSWSGGGMLKNFINKVIITSYLAINSECYK